MDQKSKAILVYVGEVSLGYNETTAQTKNKNKKPSFFQRRILRLRVEEGDP